MRVIDCTEETTLSEFLDDFEIQDLEYPRTGLKVEIPIYIPNYLFLHNVDKDLADRLILATDSDEENAVREALWKINTAAAKFNEQLIADIADFKKCLEALIEVSRKQPEELATETETCTSETNTTVAGTILRWLGFN